jgi:5-(hydroxymethyl)furfural/furfural oxidase
VLLIDSGPDFSSGDEPPWIRDARFRAHHDPALFAPFFPIEPTSQRVTPYRQPRLIGGGSAVNGMHAQRGLPDDYDAWEAYGVQGWSWDDVLPFFTSLERDMDFTGPEHGNAGPIPISRVPLAQWSSLSLAVRAALSSQGLPQLSDLNSAVGDGVGPVPLNIVGLERVSTAAAYLTPAVRSRPNLTIRGRCRATRVLFEGSRAAGVETQEVAGIAHYRARETILAAGVYQSPALLLRSGIGPIAALRECGIAVVGDRPGVGRTLHNHAQLPLTVHLRSGGRQRDSLRPPCAMVARYSSGLTEAGNSDMLFNLWERIPGSLAEDPLSRQFAVIMVLVNRAFSKGSVSLRPEDPLGEPRIRCNTLEDSRDLDRMVEGFQRVSHLLGSREVSPLVNEAFFATPSKVMQSLLRYDRRAAMVSAVGAMVLSGAGPARKLLLKGKGIMLNDVLRDPQTARSTILSLVQPSGHGTATCRMGDAADPYAVTDSSCRVIGIDSLRVVDGSIFPMTMRAGTHLPIIMAAEKAADMIKRDRCSRAG